MTKSHFDMVYNAISKGPGLHESISNISTISTASFSGTDGDVSGLCFTDRLQSTDTSAPSVSSESSEACPATDALLPFVIAWGEASYFLPLPQNLYFLATYLRDAFLEIPHDALVNKSEAFCDDQSDALLLARWLEFIAERGSGGPYGRLLQVILCHFETKFLSDTTIHVFVSRLQLSSQAKQQILRSYFLIKSTLGIYDQKPSALIQAVTNESARLYAIFGGQGNTATYFEELRTLYQTYGCFIKDFVTSMASQLIDMSQEPTAKSLLDHGLDPITWLQQPESTPHPNYLLFAPVSLPLIGLLQLAHFAVACHILRQTPGELHGRFKGFSGHSQGILVASAVSASSSWSSFTKNAHTAITVLFVIGMRCQQAVPPFQLDQAVVQDAVSHEVGSPSPMLSVRDLSQLQLQHHIDAINGSLSKDHRVDITLRNGPRSFVVGGRTKSLYALQVNLRGLKAVPGQDQTRVPHSKRKPDISTRFLPVTAPFHHRSLKDAASAIEEELETLGVTLKPEDLRTAVFDTITGRDLRCCAAGSNLIPYLVRMVTIEKVNWDLATVFPEATHIVDFGPGGTAGIGALTGISKEGSGIRVIFAGALDTSSTEFGSQAELFDCSEESVVYNENWYSKYRPTLVRKSTGETHLKTKLSSLLSLPPILVAGMTPTTVHWDFVVATMTAGYQVELAGGGYHNEDAMRNAIRMVAELSPRGRGIAVNVLCVSPRTIAWQISLLRQLRAEGMPIEGLTLGGGVPSLPIAKEYIETIGLRYMSFKPGTVQGILDVIEIAKECPNFPIILQWTGGRGGGHHSCEDFHQPILNTYSRIRKCRNLILVAGSGFGGSEHGYHYLTGAWSVEQGFAAMPFDGILLGSWVATAKEAHTSLAAKMAIVEAQGTSADQWEDTYSSKGGGGVLTVISEMGQPIHKLATRGVKLWAELDRTVFSLPKEQRLSVLEKQRNYIIQRLNADFQKVWFGCKDGQPVELCQMTYSEVAHRLVDLLYVKSRSDWIDPSYGALVSDFFSHIKGRFRHYHDDFFDTVDTSSASKFVAEVPTLLRSSPGAEDRLMSERDIQAFSNFCRKPGRKPVPFILALDKNFETYFKKDSLWQSEDLEAVVGHDVGRTCILQGPVAVRHATTFNKPISQMLDYLNSGLVAAVKRQLYDDDSSQIPVVGYFHSPAHNLDEKHHKISINFTPSETTYSLLHGSSFELPDTSQWMWTISGNESNWLLALLTSDKLVVNTGKCVSNIFRQLLAPTEGLSVSIKKMAERGQVILRARKSHDQEFLRITYDESVPGDILVEIFNPATPSGQPTPLQLRYKYAPNASYAPIREIMDGRTARVKDFYRRTWLRDTALDFDVNMNLETLETAKFYGQQTTIATKRVHEFTHMLSNVTDPSSRMFSAIEEVPMDLVFVLAWDALVKPLFLNLIDGDILRLVHLSNSYQAMGPPLRVGDEIQAMSQVTCIANQSSGKLVEVTCTVTRQGSPAVEITTQFLFRGKFSYSDTTFHKYHETPMRVPIRNYRSLAVLKTRKWLRLEDPDSAALIGKDVVFRLQTVTRGTGETANMTTMGTVDVEERDSSLVRIGTVEYSIGDSIGGSPVISYLERHGAAVESRIELQQPLAVSADGIKLCMPESNDRYARISGDFNPIHTVDAFAQYCELPGKITHGMYTSAVIRNTLSHLTGLQGRMWSYKTSFEGMVLPRDELILKTWHTAMVAGRKAVRFEACKSNNGDLVVRGDAEIDQPLSAYVFTGQGSQEVGMGMDLYASSKVAAGIWDRADKYLVNNYGMYTDHNLRIPDTLM